jgi:DNA polymerase-1
LKRTLLIDGDIAVFKAASASEEAIPFEDDLIVSVGNPEKALALLQTEMDDLQETLKADAVVLCFSDPARRYFRHDVLPTYKAHRVGSTGKKPLVFPALYEAACKVYQTYVRPNLEGDDVLGILSTSKTLIEGEKIIVSIDKDMQCIPGLLYRDGEVKIVTDREADYYHMYQTLIGDSTDGYSGCPGVGPVGAKKVLDPIEPCQWWSAVVETFTKHGFGESYALQQARVARILRASEYNFKKKEAILWNPPTSPKD